MLNVALPAVLVHEITGLTGTHGGIRYRLKFWQVPGLLKGGYGPVPKAQIELFHWLTLLGSRPVAQYVRVTGRLPTAVSGPVI